MITKPPLPEWSKSGWDIPAPAVNPCGRSIHCDLAEVELPAGLQIDMPPRCETAE
jgi:hypothetical protein